MNPDALRPILVGLAAVIAACSDSGTESSSNVPLSPEEFRAEVVAESGIDLVPMSLDDWEFEMKDISGQVVVLDYWATWCIPCIERFPHMVEMSHTYPDHQVRFISVNLDDPGDPEAYISALDFLDTVEADFENYHMTAGMFDSFSFFGLKSIPAVSIYNRAGDEAVRLTGDDPNNQFDEADVEEAIDRLLQDEPEASEV